MSYNMSYKINFRKIKTLTRRYLRYYIIFIFYIIYYTFIFCILFFFFT